MNFLVRVLGFFGVFLATTPACATITTYYTRASFDDVALGATIETFDAFAYSPFYEAPVNTGSFALVTYGGNPSLTYNAIIFNTASPSVNGTPYVRALTYKQNFSDIGVDLIFDTPIFAFGADFTNVGEGTPIPSQSTLAIVVDGVRFAVPYPLLNSTFFGFTSTNAFTTVRFSDEPPEGGDIFGFDNVTFLGSGPVVPEPATWMMLLIGFISTGAALRHRPKQPMAIPM